MSENSVAQFPEEVVGGGLEDNNADVNIKTNSNQESELDLSQGAQCIMKLESDDIGVTTGNGDCASATVTLSKRQLKKLKKKELYLAKKDDKRKEMRMKRKQKRQEAKEQGLSLGPSRKSLKHNNMKKSSCKIQVAIDSSFDDLMSDKDIKMLVKQYQRCYAANRRVEDPMQFYITSFGGRTLDKLKSYGHFRGWDIYYKSENYIEAFGKDNVVYLSSDSDNVLMELDPSKVYIIGGLVDHNHHKGLCHRLAEEKGIAHAQLPIGEFLDMKTRKVLTINHVFEIILKFVKLNDWERAFYEVIPKRKLTVVAKTKQVTKQVDSANSLSGSENEWDGETEKN